MDAIRVMNLEQIKNNPVDRVVTYARVVVDFRPHKEDPNRVRITAGGNLITYPDKLTTRTSDFTVSKILWNSVLSTDDARYATLDIANLYFGIPLDRYEYTKIPLSIFSQIVRAAARRLDTMIPGAEAKCVHRLEILMEHHEIVDKVQRLLHEVQSGAELKVGLDALDAEMRQYMCAAEKKCRRIKSGRIHFCPKASKWIRRAQVYRSLLRFHAGKIRNLGNLNQAARRCGI